MKVTGVTPTALDLFTDSLLRGLAQKERIVEIEPHTTQSSVIFVRQSHCLSLSFRIFSVSTKSVGNFNVYLPLYIKEENPAEKIC